MFTHWGKVPMRLPKQCWPVSVGESGRMAWRAHWGQGPWGGMWSPAPWSPRTRRWWTATHRTLQPSLLIFWLVLSHHRTRGKALYFHRRRGRRWGQISLERIDLELTEFSWISSTYTYNKVIPPALLNNLLHALIIRGSHSISEEENQNKVDIIADIKN